MSCLLRSPVPVAGTWSGTAEVSRPVSPQRHPQSNTRMDVIMQMSSTSTQLSILRAVIDAGTETGKNQEERMSPSTWESLRSCFRPEESVPWAEEWVEDARLTNQQTHKPRSHQDRKEEHREMDGHLGFVMGRCTWVKVWRMKRGFVSRGESLNFSLKGENKWSLMGPKVIEDLDHRELVAGH